MEQEYINQPNVQRMTGEDTPDEVELSLDEKETIEEAYAILTKLIILGGELQDEKLVQACENVQDIIDEL